MDNLHWTVLNKKGRDVDAVAIDTDRLRYWLNRCTEAGLTVVQVLPDAILLPVSDGGNTLVSVEGGYWMCYSPFGACETDAALLPLLLSQQRTVTLSATAMRQRVCRWMSSWPGSIRWC